MSQQQPKESRIARAKAILEIIVLSIAVVSFLGAALVAASGKARGWIKSIAVEAMAEGVQAAVAEAVPAAVTEAVAEAVPAAVQAAVAEAVPAAVAEAIAPLEERMNSIENDVGLLRLAVSQIPPARIPTDGSLPIGFVRQQDFESILKRAEETGRIQESAAESLRTQVRDLAGKPLQGRDGG